ncbi:MAG: alpha/beta hydrolase [Oligoflexia bacterium]|nr:alpha/beta hydrolase [Oligoflexia bacterium]
MREWILLRGLIRESAHWMGFEKLLQQSYPNDKVHCLDLPGTGEYFQLTSPKKVSEYVNFLKDKSSQNIKEKIIIGISFGGMISIEWINQYPDFFHKAFIINSSFSNISPFYHRLRPDNYISILKLFLQRSIQTQEETIFKMTVNLKNNSNQIVSDWLKIQEKHPVSKKSAFNQLLASSKYRLPTNKPQTPIIVLGTTADRLVHSQCSLEFAKKWDLKKYIHSEAGHDLSLDAPEWILECIKREVNLENQDH